MPKHSKVHVPARKGSRHGSAKLNESLVVRIRSAAHEDGFFPVADEARRRRVTYHAVRDALRGATYRHVNKVVKPFRGPTRRPSTGCIVRIDSESTHGFQARYRGRSKFFSDGRHGRRAKSLARRWLELTVG